MEKIRESYNIECHNCSHKNLCGEKSKNIHYLYVDIASLKFIVRKLLKQNSQLHPCWLNRTSRSCLTCIVMRPTRE
jgi:DNA-directed RNA polymerase subunit RPC12/RpoP